MAERQRAERERAREHAADALARIGVVIAGDPHPVAAALQLMKLRAVGRGKPGGAAAVVEIVAERDHDAGGIARDDRAESFQRRRGIIGRHQHAAHGKGRAFFEMQVGDDERAFVGPVERAGEVGDEGYARRP